MVDMDMWICGCQLLQVGEESKSFTCCFQGPPGDFGPKGTQGPKGPQGTMVTTPVM